MVPESKLQSPIDCPKCMRQMAQMPLEGLSVDFCPTCKGIWFDGGELERGAGVPVGQSATVYNSRPQPTRYRCPRCSQELFERQIISDRKESLLVEQCHTCSGVFLDRGEYVAAKRACRVHAKKIVPSSKEQSRDSADSVVVEADSEGAMLFQYITGLPLEVGGSQKLFSPVVTVIIALNVLFLAYAYYKGLDDSISRFGMVPSYVLAYGKYTAIITSMFMHAGIAHLLGNMYFLFVVGDNIEDDFGSIGFLVLYFLCGIAADIGHIYSNVNSNIPCVGASGAISGVIGAYIVMYPARKFLCRIFYLAWLNFAFEVPAFVFFGLWILLQIIFAAFNVQGVAWWAHVAGFSMGASMALTGRVLGWVTPSRWD